MENDGGEGSARVGGWKGQFWVTWCRQVTPRCLKGRDPKEVGRAEIPSGMVHLAGGAANADAWGSGGAGSCRQARRRPSVPCVLVASGVTKVSGRLTSS